MKTYDKQLNSVCMHIYEWFGAGDSEGVQGGTVPFLSFSNNADL